MFLYREKYAESDKRIQNDKLLSKYTKHAKRYCKTTTTTTRTHRKTIKHIENTFEHHQHFILLYIYIYMYINSIISIF